MRELGQHEADQPLSRVHATRIRAGGRGRHLWRHLGRVAPLGAVG